MREQYIKIHNLSVEKNLADFVKNELTVSDRPELTAADIIVSGGRGMQNGENFALLEAVVIVPLKKVPTGLFLK